MLHFVCELREPKTLWTEVPACAGTTGQERRVGIYTQATDLFSGSLDIRHGASTSPYAPTRLVPASGPKGWRTSWPRPPTPSTTEATASLGPKPTRRYPAVREPPMASVTFCPRPEGDSPEITPPGGEVVRLPAGSTGGCRGLMRLEEVAHLVYRLGLYVF